MFQRLVILPFLIGIFVVFLHPIDSDGDFFQHVNIGRSLLEEKSFPHTDEFTFTAKGKEYIGYSWGTGVIFYLLYSSTGPIGINIFIATVAVVTFLLLYVLLKEISQSNRIALLILTLVAPVISTRFPSRPEVITYPFVIALFLIDQLKVKHPRIVLLFPFLILLWANLYGVSVIVGMGLLLLFALRQWISDGLKLRSPMVLFYISILVSMPLAFFNGYGASSVFFILLIPQMTEFHGDWAGIGKIITNAPIEYFLVFQYKLLMFFLYVAFLLFVVLLGYRKIRSNLFFLFTSLGLLVPFVVARQIPLAVIASTPLFAVLLSAHMRWRRFVFGSALVIGLMLTSLAIWINPPGTGEATESFPPTMISFLKTNQIGGNVFNTQRIGSFLSYQLYPSVKVFSDTRDDLFVGTGVLEEMGTALNTPIYILSFLDRHNIEIVIADLREGASYSNLLYSNRWVVVYLDSIYLIFVRDKVAEEKKLLTYEAIDPFAISGIRGDKAELAVSQYQSIIAGVGQSYNHAMRLASALLSVGKYNEAIEILTKQEVRFGPQSIFAAIQRDYLLAQTYFAIGDCQNTKKSLDKTKFDVTGRLIFSPGTELLSPVHKGYAFYYILCEKNKALAQAHLEKYLSRSEIDEAERKTTREQFAKVTSSPH